jgi:hypothetical protein
VRALLRHSSLGPGQRTGALSTMEGEVMKRQTVWLARGLAGLICGAGLLAGCATPLEKAQREADRIFAPSRAYREAVYAQDQRTLEHYRNALGVNPTLPSSPGSPDYRDQVHLERMKELERRWAERALEEKTYSAVTGPRTSSQHESVQRFCHAVVQALLNEPGRRVAYQPGVGVWLGGRFIQAPEGCL